MKDIQQNSPYSTGTYPLKKHNHKDASSEAALTHTWTMILSHWSSVQSWKSSGKWFLIQHGHMNLSLVQLEPCSIVAHYYTHYTMMNSATGARLPFLRLLAWFRSWRPNWKKCHCVFLLQINPHFEPRELEGAFIILQCNCLCATRSAKIINQTCKIVYFQVVA